MSPLLSIEFGHYPASDKDVPHYKDGIRKAFNVPEKIVPVDGEVPKELLDTIPPLPLTAYDMTRARDLTGRLNPGIILGSASDFDDLTLFWNLRAAGAPLCFYDQASSARFKPFVDAFLDKLRLAAPGVLRANVWMRRQIPLDESWRPDLDLRAMNIVLCDEAKTECAIDEEDVRKLGKLASAIPRHLAQSFILFSKSGTFSSEEVRFAGSLNSEYERRVILWSRDELEPYFLYERSANKLGQRRFATTLTDMANITHDLWFA